jgi:predicted transcriptional regulator
MGHIENKHWKKNPKNGTIVTKYLKVFIDDEKATLTQLNRICGLNYDVFYHVWVPKRRIHMNVLVDAIPNLKNENLGVGMMVLIYSSGLIGTTT